MVVVSRRFFAGVHAAAFPALPRPLHAHAGVDPRQVNRLGAAKLAAGDQRPGALDDVVGFGGLVVNQRAGLRLGAVQPRHRRQAAHHLAALHRLIDHVLRDLLFQHRLRFRGGDELRGNLGTRGRSGRRSGCGRLHT